MKMRGLLLGLLAVVIIYSCQKSNHDGTTPPPLAATIDSLTVSRAKISLTSLNSYSDTLLVSANVNWSISIAAGGDWLSIDNQKGGSGRTTITLSAKKSDSSRVAKLTMTPGGNSAAKPVTFTVTQPAFSLVWQRSFGGSSDDVVLATAQTADGGVVCAGGTYSIDGDITGNSVSFQRGWIVKVDAAGVKQWQRTMGQATTSGGPQQFNGIVVTADGGIVVAGTGTNNDGSGTREELWVVKLDASGNILWNKYYAAPSIFDGVAISSAPDGGLLVATSPYSADVWLLKLNSNGDKLWDRTFGGTGPDIVTAVTASPDGGFVLTGFSASSDGDLPANKGSWDVMVFKVDADGNTQWVKNYGGSGGDYATAITTTPDGGYLVTGYTKGNDGDFTGNHSSFYDELALKIDKNGEKVWVKLLGGSGDDAGYAVTVSADGNAMIAGYTHSIDGDIHPPFARAGEDIWLVRLDASGTILWQDSYGGLIDDIGYSIFGTADGGFVVGGAGSMVGPHGGGDGLLIKVK